MNKTLKSLSIEKILFWDLEVVREYETLDPESEAFHLFEAKTRDKITGNVLEESEVINLYNKSGALYPTHAKIVCATMGIVKKGVLYIKSITGSQKDIITIFCETLSKDYIPCGYNIIQYDFPILRQKAFQENLLDIIPERFNDAGKKEWTFSEVNRTVNVVDLMLYLRGTHYATQSLAEACYLAGIPSPKNDGIEGSRVSEVYYQGGIERIREYCERDVVSVVHLLQRMQGEPLIDNIVYLEPVSTVPETLKTSQPLFEKIKNAGKIADAVGKELLETSKTLTEDECMNLVLILKACLGKKDSELTDKENKLFDAIWKK